MKIVEVTDKNFEEFRSDLIHLLKLQMAVIGEDHNLNSIEEALENSFKLESRAHVFLAINENNETVGLCFLNVCSGIQSGGDYVWINEIYIREKERGKGYAKVLLKHIEEWAKTKGCKYLAGQTGIENIASQRLFVKAVYNKSKVKSYLVR